MTQIITTVAELRAALAQLKPTRTGLVPTMGALHDGHVSLVQDAKKHCDHVVVSIFVNPTQFAPHEDFDAYPRTLDADLKKLADSAAIVFAPTAREIYPDGFATTITVGGPSAGLETDFRPHFFDGVATIVAKLLIAAKPDWAMFGEKDYQQLLVIRRLARDLDLGVEIVAVPIAREEDGLAMSSRNAYLSPSERKIAGQLNAVMREVIARLQRGTGIVEAEAFGAAAIKDTGFDTVDYVALRDAQTLDPITAMGKPARLLVAARICKTRLIDNMAV